MFKKLKPGLLLVILVVLVGVYYFTQYMNQGDRTFRERIVDFDLEEVTQIIINDPQIEGVVDLRRDTEGWEVVIDGKLYRADSNVALNIMKQLDNLETKRYAGKGEEAWEKYQVTDTIATVVQLKKENQELAKVLLGKFSYSVPEDQQQQPQMMGGQQPKGEMTTYVRLEGDPEVFAVDGFLKMNFNREASTYRDRTLTALGRPDIMRVNFDYPGESATLSRQGDQWYLNEQPADSASAANYIAAIARITSPNFVNESLASGNASHKVTIEGNNFRPVIIEAYPVADTNINYVVHSSHNVDAYFDGKKSNLFEKIFVETSTMTNTGE